MPQMDEMRQGGGPFDPFLYATVGEDRNGNAVTVLSTLARLGLEPWDAAAELAGLTRGEALGRLDGLLGRFRDVPALGQDHAAIALRLIGLLPKTASRGMAGLPERARFAGAPGLGLVIAMLMVIIYLVNALFLGSDWTGN